MSDSIILAKVEDFVDKNDAFTSVDVANSIKRDGTWVRNRKVAAWLRSTFFSTFNQVNYKQTMVDVGQGRQANLYHPDFYDPCNYTGADQNALNPDDFNALHPGGVPAAQITTSSDDDDEEDFNENSRTVKVAAGERVWIPTSIVSQLGMNPGDDADNVKLSFIYSSKLTVHDDGRVSVYSRNIDPTLVEGDKIKIYVKDSIAVYEKV